MSFRRAFGALLAAFCLCFSATAHAEPWTRKSFLMPEGSFEITGDPARPTLMDINLSRDSVGRPVTISPHFYWAPSDDLSLGISHETGLCLNECDKVYNDAGFDLMYYLTGSNRFELDLHVGLPVHSFDPLFVGARAGVIGRLNIGDITAFVFDPSLYIGFSNRDRGNREYLYLPVWFYFQATETVVPFVGTAVHGPLDGFGDAVQIPIEGGVLFNVTQNVDLGVGLRFGNLLGRGGSVDWRDLMFLARFRF